MLRFLKFIGVVQANGYVQPNQEPSFKFNKYHPVSYLIFIFFCVCMLAFALFCAVLDYGNESYRTVSELWKNLFKKQV